MSAPELTRVVINGIEVNSYLKKWESDVTQSNASIKGIKITLVKAVESVLTLDKTLSGKAVTVQRGVSLATEAYIFRGEVHDVTLAGGTVEIICIDKLEQTSKRTVTKSYDSDIDVSAGKYSEIFKDLINNFTDLTADATSVQDSGTVNVIKKFICRSVSVFDRLKTLADTIGWQFYYNPDTDKVHFEPVGYINQAVTVQSGVNINETPKWSYDSDNLYNVIELRGAYQTVETTESGRIGTTADYTTTDILLTQTPVSTKVFCDSATPPTTLKIGGATGATAVFDYSIDTINKKIVWSSTFTPGAADYVIVQYSYNLPVPILVNNFTSETEYGTKKQILHKYDITDIEDAEQYANEYLELHKEPILKTTIKVLNISDLEAGQKVRVVDNFHNIDDYFYIVKIKQQYPYKADEIEIVNKIINTDMFGWEINQRVKRLEEKELGDSDLLIHVMGLSRDIDYERRYVMLQQQNIAGEVGIYGHSIYGIYGTAKYGATTSGGFVLGHPTFGVLGTSMLGTGASDPVITRIIQGNNIYKEFIYDDDFYDDVLSSGVTWNTTTKEITIAIDGELITKDLFLGQTYSQFNLQFGSITGTYTVYATGDKGTTWQEVTSLNSNVNFNVTDNTGVQLKIVATTETVIANTYKDFGNYDLPAIRLRVIE